MKADRMGAPFDDPQSHSRALFRRARRGASTSARTPLSLAVGRGWRVTDVNGVEQIDAITRARAVEEIAAATEWTLSGLGRG